MAPARLFALVLALAGGGVRAGDLPAQQILARSYAATRPADSTADIRMVLRSRAGKERVRQLTLYSKRQGAGPDAMYALHFRSPADISGTATLLVQRSGGEDDMWVYLSALRKTRRLFSDNKRDSFMGSDLSYGDILGHRPSDWTASLLGDDVYQGVPVYVLQVVPASAAVRSSSGYGKRILMIDKSNFVSLRTDFLDAAGAPLKTISVSEVKPLDARGTWQFMRLEAENLQKGTHTTLVFENFEHDTGLSGELFTTGGLERGPR